MRFAGLLLLALSACWQASPEALDGDDDNGPSGDLPECVTAADCTGAAASCCECPTYAVSRASGWGDSCEEVCEAPPSGCSAAPACAAGTCVLECVPVTCGLTCPGGFAADSVGCLSCACGGGSPLPPAECAIDADCVQVPADCCGCATGGADTAVPAGEAESFDDGLGCGDMEACPGVNVCDPEVVPRCLGGSCALAAPPATDEPDPVPTGYCGSPDLPACPAGQVCVLNDPAAMDATAAGLGICRSQ